MFCIKAARGYFERTLRIWVHNAIIQQLKYQRTLPNFLKRNINLLVMYTLLTARGYNQGKPCLTRPFIKEERGKDEHCKLEDILASLCVQPEGKSYCSHSVRLRERHLPPHPFLALHCSVSKLGESCHKRCMGSVFNPPGPSLLYWM